MKFTIDSHEYDWEVDTLTTAEASLIYEHTQLGLWAFGKGLLDGNPNAIRAAVLIAKMRAGEAVRWQDLGAIAILPLAKQMFDELIKPVLPADPQMTEPAAESGPVADGTNTTPGSDSGISPVSESADTQSP